MRIEGKDDSWPAKLSGVSLELFDDERMAGMDPIEIADGQRSPLGPGGNFVEMSVKFHRG